MVEEWHGGQVERVARGRLEGADAALAEDDVRVAGGDDVLGGHEPLLDRGAEPRLSMTGRAARPTAMSSE